MMIYLLFITPTGRLPRVKPLAADVINACSNDADARPVSGQAIMRVRRDYHSKSRNAMRVPKSSLAGRCY